MGKSENERPAAEACQHSYITSSQHLAVIMGGSRNASLALTGWLHLHFWLTTAPHHVAGPPPQPRSPVRKTPGRTGAVRSSACVLLSCLHLIHHCSVSLLAYVKIPSLSLFFFQDGLVGSFSHQSTSTELPGPGVCVCMVELRFLLQCFRKLIKLVSRLQQFNVFEPGCSFTTVMLFFQPVNLIFLLFQWVCVCARTRQRTRVCRDECDLLVPGEQRGDTTPAPPGNDLCGPG